MAYGIYLAWRKIAIRGKTASMPSLRLRGICVAGTAVVLLSAVSASAQETKRSAQVGNLRIAKNLSPSEMYSGAGTGDFEQRRAGERRMGSSGRRRRQRTDLVRAERRQLFCSRVEHEIVYDGAGAGKGWAWIPISHDAGSAGRTISRMEN